MARFCPHNPDKPYKSDKPDRPGKTYNAKRVSFLLPDVNSATTTTYFQHMLPVNDLLIASGVRCDIDTLDFKSINVKQDARFNSFTGVPGFIPIPSDNCMLGVDTEEGGVAQNILVGGILVD